MLRSWIDRSFGKLCGGCGKNKNLRRGNLNADVAARIEPLGRAHPRLQRRIEPLHDDLEQFHLPEEAARQILRGWQRGDFEIHFPKRFTLWLKGLRLLAYGPYFAAVRRSTGL